jgi:4-oxalocrotonate tautomerase
MPLVDIQVIKGVFTPQQRTSMISKVTDAMVQVAQRRAAFPGLG